jgi:simple sugar transport system permease protein
VDIKSPGSTSRGDRTAVAVADGATAAGAQPARQDERLVRVSWLTRLMQRPGLGALMGAIVIFVIFAGFDATPNHLWLTQAGIAAWSQQAAFFGIMAVPVGLLMIGGEFDLSAGVMTGVAAVRELDLRRRR